ncbi:MAG: FHA domain-containing protein [Longimicrobiales bacterium]|nr:FHA domain-containing protein [Longimicrobiales bacterium]
MPKLTLLLGRRVMQAYDFKQASIIVGRDDGADVLIDNPSVSRRHAEIRLDDNGWVVEDLGSSNGTYFQGQKITGAQSIGLGDEIGFGKFSIIFGKALGEGEVPVAKPSPMADKPAPSRPSTMPVEGTMHINPHEVKELLKDADRKKRKHFLWESGDEQGTHYLSDQPAVLVGTDDLCDIQVPRGPKHHVLIITVDGKCEIRYLAMFGSMTVRGRGTKRATLKNGDVVEVGGLKITFMDDVA